MPGARAGSTSYAMIWQAVFDDPHASLAMIDKEIVTGEPGDVIGLGRAATMPLRSAPLRLICRYSSRRERSHTVRLFRCGLVKRSRSTVKSRSAPLGRWGRT